MIQESTQLTQILGNVLLFLALALSIFALFSCAERSESKDKSISKTAIKKVTTYAGTLTPVFNVRVTETSQEVTAADSHTEAVATSTVDQAAITSAVSTAVSAAISTILPSVLPAAIPGSLGGAPATIAKTLAGTPPDPSASDLAMPDWIGEALSAITGAAAGAFAVHKHSKRKAKTLLQNQK